MGISLPAHTETQYHRQSTAPRIENQFVSFLVVLKTTNVGNRHLMFLENEVNPHRAAHYTYDQNRMHSFKLHYSKPQQLADHFEKAPN